MGMNPVAWRGASGGEATIKELTALELKELAYRVLSKIANTNGVGTVNVSTNTSLTLIGTFEDTFRGANTTGAGATNTEIGTTTYSFRQNLTTDYPESTPPNFYYAANTAYPLTESNTSVYETLANNILYYCTFDEGPNSYRIDTTSPAVTYGGTWEIVTTITDSQYASTQDTITYNLYKRVDDGGYTPLRPLKPGAVSGTLNEFTDTDITNIARIVRQRIKDTGLANYSFGESAPVTGTWSAVGTIIDRISDAEATYTTVFSTPIAYDTDYIEAVPYVSTYYGPQEFTTDYLTNITYLGQAAFNFDYLGFPVTYTGTDYFGPASFIAPIYYGPQAYSGTIINPDGAAFTDPDDLYLGRYVGAGFTGPTYVGPPQVGLGTGYVGTYYGQTPYYADVGSVTYSGENVLPFYTLYYGPSQYYGALLFTSANVNPFDGPTYLAPATYLGPATFTNANVNPFDGANFSGPATYLGPSPFVNPNVNPFAGPIVDYLRGTAYIRNPAYVGPKGTFTGPTTTYTGPPFITYTRDPIYIGPQAYIGDDAASFINPTGVPYTRTYLGPQGYIGDDATSFINPDVTPYILTYLGPQAYTGNETNYGGAPIDGDFFFSVRYYGPDPADPGPYVGPNRYLGPPGTYPFYSVSPYYSPYPFYGLFFGSYYGPITYFGPAPSPQNFINPNANPFQTSYVGDDAALFASQYLNTDTTAYTTTYTGDDVNPFSSSPIPYTTGYIGDNGATFTGPTYSADPAYTTTYTGSLDYTNEYVSPTDYLGPGGTYVAPGIVIATTTTVITKYLWRRVA